MHRARQALCRPTIRLTRSPVLGRRRWPSRKNQHLGFFKPLKMPFVLIHLGDPLIRLESLYRYLRKFQALGRRRYVLVSARHIPAALVVMLSLEFLPRSIPSALRRSQEVSAAAAR